MHESLSLPSERLREARDARAADPFSAMVPIGRRRGGVKIPRRTACAAVGLLLLGCVLFVTAIDFYAAHPGHEVTRNASSAANSDVRPHTKCKPASNTAGRLPHTAARARGRSSRSRASRSSPERESEGGAAGRHVVSRRFMASPSDARGNSFFPSRALQRLLTTPNESQRLPTTRRPHSIWGVGWSKHAHEYGVGRTRAPPSRSRRDRCVCLFVCFCVCVLGMWA